MLKLRHLVVVLGMLYYPVASPAAQVSIGIGLPHVSIGVNLSSYPRLVRVPNYPVYYDPYMQANYFFYDGMYWVFENDNWYASSWYNGPWWFVSQYDVPLFVLRIPVRYYRLPPAYFRGWRHDAPPRWGDHWGRDWEQRRGGWDRWDRRAAPRPAPLPDYQRKYSGNRYPSQVEQQQQLHQKEYRYQPRDPVVRQHYQAQPVQKAPAQQQNRSAPDQRGYGQTGPAPTRSQPSQSGGKDAQPSTPASPKQGSQNAQKQGQPQPGQRDQPAPGAQGQEKNQQGKDAARKPKPGQKQDEELDQYRTR